MIGQTLGHYKIIGKLGEGGMGEVYRAEDTTLDRDVALKVLPPDLAQSQERLDRFEREAKTLAALDHPNIVYIHTVEEADGVRFLTMQLVDGKPLSELIPPNGMALEQIFKIATPMADALASAHQKGIIHRDLKPANVMVTTDGRVKVLDFGLAKVSHDAAPISTELATEPLTQDGLILGTMPYMSPEQLQGTELDSRSDVFSLGVMLYEMATGERPFKGDTSATLIMSIGLDTAPEVDSVRGELPHHLGRVIGRCLEKDPEDRFQTVKDVRNEFRSLQKETDSQAIPASQAATPSGQSPLRKWRPVIVAVGMTVVALALWFALRDRQPDSQTDMAAVKAESAEASMSDAAATDSGTTIDDRKMIVVIPFGNLGAPEDEYFADGMTEEITNRLALVNGLGVISRNSADQLAESNKTTQQIGEELGVDYLLAGSIRWSDSGGGSSRVRISQQLVRVADDTHIWAESFDRPLEDIFEVQSEIAAMVVDQLGVALLGSERQEVAAQPTENIEAYQAFLQAKHQERLADWSKKENLQLRVDHLTRALQLDPHFAPAWSDLVGAHGQFYSLGYDRSPERRKKAQLALEKAEELAPNTATSQLDRAVYLYLVERDFEQVLRELAVPAMDRPYDHVIQGMRLSALRRLGRFDEAAAIGEDLLRLDPLNPRSITGLGNTYLYLRQFPRALQHFRSSISLAPDQSAAYGSEALLHWAWKGDTVAARASLLAAPDESSSLAHTWYWQRIYEGQYVEALERLESDPMEWFGQPVFFRPKELLAGYAYELSGEADLARSAFRAAAERLESELEKQPNSDKLHSALGVAYAAMGRKDEAVQEGIRATEITPLAEHPFFGLVHVEDLAWIFTLVGEHDLALAELETLLSMPSHITAPLLDLDPRWDPIRDDPRFQAMLEKHELE